MTMNTNIDTATPTEIPIVDDAIPVSIVVVSGGGGVKPKIFFFQKIFSTSNLSTFTGFVSDDYTIVVCSLLSEKRVAMTNFHPDIAPICSARTSVNLQCCLFLKLIFYDWKTSSATKMKPWSNSMDPHLE